METVANVAHREPWNKGKIVGQSVVDGQRGALLRGVDAGLQLRQPLGIALRRWRQARRLVAHAAALRVAFLAGAALAGLGVPGLATILA